MYCTFTILNRLNKLNQKKKPRRLCRLERRDIPTTGKRGGYYSLLFLTFSHDLPNRTQKTYVNGDTQQQQLTAAVYSSSSSLSGNWYSLSLSLFLSLPLRASLIYQNVLWLNGRVYSISYTQYIYTIIIIIAAYWKGALFFLCFPSFQTDPSFSISASETVTSPACASEPIALCCCSHKHNFERERERKKERKASRSIATCATERGARLGKILNFKCNTVPNRRSVNYSRFIFLLFSLSVFTVYWWCAH